MYKIIDTTNIPVEIQNAITTLINYNDPDYNNGIIDRIVFEKSNKDGIRRMVFYYKSGDWMVMPISEY